MNGPPSRGDVWLADLNPVQGHEQAGRRPVLVVSDDVFNHGPAGLVIVCPLTRTLRAIPSHIHLAPPEGGLKAASAVLSEQVRAISTSRLIARWGAVSPDSLRRASRVLHVLIPSASP